MKIKISIPQIRCANVTHPRTQKDEVYMGFFVSLAKSGEEINKPALRKYVCKHVSDVKKNVKKNTTWVPENMETIVETGDATALYLTMGLYEYDNGGIYKKLKANSDVLVTPDDFDWTCIELPTDITSVLGWVKSVWKLLSYSFNYLMEDDLLGTSSIAVPDVVDLEQREWTGRRELRFKAWGGDYRVSLDIEVLEDD